MARTFKYIFQGIVQSSKLLFIIFTLSVKTNLIFFFTELRILHSLYQLAYPSFFMVMITKYCQISLEIWSFQWVY